MKGAHRTPKGIVFNDDSQCRRAVVSFEAGDECRIETGQADLYVEVVLLQIAGELVDGTLLLETDFRVMGDVVGHCDEFGLHELMGAIDHLVAGGVWSSEPRDSAGNVERLFEGGHLLDHLGGGLSLGGSLLREQDSTCQARQEEGYRFHLGTRYHRLRRITA